MDVYFEWGTDDSYGNTTDTQTLSDTGDFDDTIDGLSDDTEYHYRAVATDGIDTWKGNDVSFTTDPPVPTGFNKRKLLDVREVTDTPTASWTVPLKITGNDDSKTGTGEIELDWTNISSKSDIGIYDENNNLLDYYFESFDDTDEEAVIWVYRDWDRDGSTQAQIFYGDGPSDQSVSADTVFDKESDLGGGWLFNETSGDLLDVTSNNNDGTISGATQGETGQVDGAYDLDGDSDYVDIPSAVSNMFATKGSVSFWIKPYSTIPDLGHVFLASSNYGGDLDVSGSGTSARGNFNIAFDTDNNEIEVVMVEDDGGASSTKVSTGISYDTWQFVTLVWNDDGLGDGDEVKLFVDGSEVDTYSGSLYMEDFFSDETSKFRLGNVGDENKGRHFDGLEDSFFVNTEALSLEDHNALYDSSKASPDFFSQQAGESTEEEYIPKVIMVN